LKESDIFLTRETWRIALDLNLSTYNAIISTVKADISSVELQKWKFTSVSEFRQIETQLKILEHKLNDFCQFLPLLDRRRSILGTGSTILRTMLETAFLAGLDKLHNILDELENYNSDLLHSLSNRVSYVKKLDTVTGINSQAIANLTTIIKDNLVHSHEKFKI